VELPEEPDEEPLPLEAPLDEPLPELGAVPLVAVVVGATVVVGAEGEDVSTGA
jgi:hypothetical protein